MALWVRRVVCAPSPPRQLYTQIADGPLHRSETTSWGMGSRERLKCYAVSDARKPTEIERMALKRKTEGKKCKRCCTR
jgi:hypothetical protein